nr:protein EIN4-like [Tanacetum cinerariifolium]
MEVPNSLPNLVMGDEMRTFQVLLYMVGHLLDVSEEGRVVMFRVSLENGNDIRNDKTWGPGRGAVEEFVNVKFEIGTGDGGVRSELAVSSMRAGGKKQNVNRAKDTLSFNMCKKLVQMMQGKIWMSSNSQGYIQSTTLAVKAIINGLLRLLNFLILVATSNPSISGMCKSKMTTWNGVIVGPSEVRHSKPDETVVTLQPSFSRSFFVTIRFTPSSSARMT